MNAGIVTISPNAVLLFIVFIPVLLKLWCKGKAKPHSSFFSAAQITFLCGSNCCFLLINSYSNCLNVEEEYDRFSHQAASLFLLMQRNSLPLPAQLTATCPEILYYQHLPAYFCAALTVM
jgi:hypothetical protein